MSSFFSVFCFLSFLFSCFFLFFFIVGYDITTLQVSSTQHATFRGFFPSHSLLTRKGIEGKNYRSATSTEYAQTYASHFLVHGFLSQPLVEKFGSCQAQYRATDKVHFLFTTIIIFISTPVFILFLWYMQRNEIDDLEVS